MSNKPNHSNHLADLKRQADSAIGKQEWDRALELVNQIIDLEKTAKNYNNRGVIYGAMGKQDKAIDDFFNAINTNKHYVEAYFNRGCAYLIQSELEKAVDDFTEAITKKPDFYPAYHNRGVTYYHIGKYDKAIVDYTDAITHGKENSLVCLNRGNAYLANEQYDLALADYNTAIDLDKKNFGAYLLRGHVFVISKQYDKAIEDFNTAIYLNNEDWLVYFHRGNAFADTGRYEKAIVDYSKAIELAKNQERYDLFEGLYDTLARVRIKQEAQELSGDASKNRTISELRKEKEEIANKQNTLNKSRKRWWVFLFVLGFTLYGAELVLYICALYNSLIAIPTYQLLPITAIITLIISPLVWMVGVTDREAKQCAEELSDLAKEITKKEYGIFDDVASRTASTDPIAPSSKDFMDIIKTLSSHLPPQFQS